MGIPGLLPVLKSISKSLHVREYKGKRVAVDTYGWLHRGVFSCSREICQSRPTDKFIDYCMHRVRLLQHHGVIPVMVFDGGMLPMKADQEEKRARSRKENLDKALLHEQNGNMAAAFDHYQRAVDVTPELAVMLIKVLRKENVELIVAPYEADAQLAFLALNGHVDAVITEDSDMIAYGCPRVLFKMDKYGQGMEIQYNDIVRTRELSFNNFSRQMVLEMCILSGCDYLPSLHGMGVKRAHDLIRRYKTFSKVIQSLRFNGINIPHNYEENFKKAILTFQHQRVYNPRERKLVHLTEAPPDLDALSIDFVGPDLPVEIAQAVARGEFSPITYKPFEILPAVGTATLAPIVSKDFSAQFSQKRKGLQLPVQKNNLTNYFVSTSSAAKKDFRAPRASLNKEEFESSAPVALDNGQSAAQCTPSTSGVSSQEQFSPVDRMEFSAEELFQAAEASPDATNVEMLQAPIIAVGDDDHWIGSHARKRQRSDVEATGLSQHRSHDYTSAQPRDQHLKRQERETSAVAAAKPPKAQPPMAVPLKLASVRTVGLIKKSTYFQRNVSLPEDEAGEGGPSQHGAGDMFQDSQDVGDDPGFLQPFEQQWDGVGGTETGGGPSSEACEPRVPTSFGSDVHHVPEFGRLGKQAIGRIASLLGKFCHNSATAEGPSGSKGHRTSASGKVSRFGGKGCGDRAKSASFESFMFRATPKTKPE